MSIHGVGDRPIETTGYIERDRGIYGCYNMTIHLNITLDQPQGWKDGLLSKETNMVLCSSWRYKDM